jgi:hypothetical protein
MKLGELRELRELGEILAVQLFQPFCTRVYLLVYQGVLP